MAPLLVSVLVVNFNGERHLPACLTALERQTLPRYQYEVILVDNASADGSVDLVRKSFPWVRRVALGRNTGFAEGNNVAARFAHGRTLVLLNNDTIPDPYFLEELIRAAGENPDGMAAAKMVFAHDPTIINSTGLFLLRDGRGADRGFRQPDAGQFEAAGPVFAGCGGAVLLPAPVAGEPLFNPRYFVYYEDLDAGWRARRAGRGPDYAPRALVRHVHGAAAGDESPLFAFCVERNRALTSLRNGDPFLATSAGLVLFAKVVQAVVRALIGRGGRWPIARAVAGAAASYLWYAPAVLIERYDRGVRPPRARAGH
ncbi:glycosyltransferase family 2 protein [Fimbriiglobus ruber]|uniref:glycosyltransferase family 2 protein n=1 Tax=Fimbriiglobus ruber TaxID=1908690 RepID=UPI00137B40C8|nr:glycosyltransferase family 2 protein [Fimbriiglobus ruber]